jgi:hypothetical protein
MTSPFIWAVGSNGYTSGPFNVLTTELTSLSVGSSAVSSVANVGGVFSQSDTANAVLGELWFVSGGAFVSAAGAYLSGYYLKSGEGSAFERAVPPSRSPDFTINLPTSLSIVSGDIFYAGGPVKLWAPKVKVLLTNNVGATIPGGSKLICGAIELVF